MNNKIMNCLNESIFKSIFKSTYIYLSTLLFLSTFISCGSKQNISNILSSEKVVVESQSQHLLIGHYLSDNKTLQGSGDLKETVLSQENWQMKLTTQDQFDTLVKTPSCANALSQNSTWVKAQGLLGVYFTATTHFMVVQLTLTNQDQQQTQCLIELSRGNQEQISDRFISLTIKQMTLKIETLPDHQAVQNGASNNQLFSLNFL